MIDVRRTTVDMREWIISVDDHVVEPPDLWLDRLPRQHHDAAPHVVRDEGREHWVYEGKPFPMELLFAAGEGDDLTGPHPLTYSEMRLGCYDPQARVEDMDRDHVLASMLFPSFPRFCGQTFNEAVDRDLALLCVKAWNDWMTEEWSAAAPGRFIPLMLLPLWDPRAGAAEIERCAAKGARAFAFSENPTHLGLPSIHDPSRYWDPVFHAANDTGTVVAIHLGSSSQLARTSADAPPIISTAWHGGVGASGAMMDFLFSGLLFRMPDLKICLAEGGIGWMPYFLNQAEYFHRLYPGKAPDGYPRDADIRQLFKDHVYGCVIVEDSSPNEAREISIVGEDNVMIESDYPHTSTSWPNSLENARRYLAGLSEDAQDKVMWGNACRVLRFEPTQLVSHTEGQLAQTGGMS
jgi:predicted TIM-barrel fold metal-dependent hydrolase